MIFSYNEKEKIIIDKITERFKEKYSIKNKFDGISIYLNKKCCSITLDICTQLSSELLLYINGDSNNCDRLIINTNDDYLEILEMILNNLTNQLSIYIDFIKGFQESIDEIYEWYSVMDLVECKLYIKNDCMQAVIVPVLELDNDNDYTTMHINSIDGNYPMKRFTSISYDDLKDDISFFVD